MRTHKPLFLLLIALFVITLGLAACQPAVQTEAPPLATATPIPLPSATSKAEEATGPRLRITNAGSEPIEDLVVLFPDSRISFGDVPAGITTAYQPAPNGVYNYAAYEYTYNGETRVQPVIDWMGETPRPAQNFTYVIQFNPNATETLPIELVEVTVDTQ